MEVTGGRRERRPLYGAADRLSAPATTLSGNYRGAGSSSISPPSNYHDDGGGDDGDVMLMTDAERASFAHDLSQLERQEEQARRQRAAARPWSERQSNHRQPRDGNTGVEVYNESRSYVHSPTQVRHAPSSLEEHFDPHLLSDTSIPSNFFPHARARRMMEESTTKVSKSEQFFEKNEKWREHVEQKNALLRKEFRAQTEQECTFRPAINRPLSPSASRGFDRNGDGSDDEDFDRGDGGDTTGGYHRSFTDRGQSLEHHRIAELDVTTRLMQFEKQRQRRLELRATELRAAEEGMYEFRPKTNKKKWTRAISPRYLDPKQPPRKAGDERSRSASAANRQEDSNAIHTGHPDTNDRILWADRSTRLDTYLHKPVHLRLHQSAMVSQERRRRDEERRLRDTSRRTGGGIDITTEAPSYVVGESTLSAIGDTTAQLESSSTTNVGALGRSSMLASAHPRQAVDDPALLTWKHKLDEDAAERQRHLDEIRAEAMAGYTFQPVTAVYKPPKDAPPPREKKEPYRPKTYSFSPKIDKASAGFFKTQSRTVNDLLKFNDDKEQKLKRQQEERELALQAEGNLNHGKPRISKYAQQIEGKISNSIRSADDYKRFLAMQRRIRQRDIEQFVRERNEAEDAELTFRPEIHEAPTYISEIVKELRESRAVSASRSRSRSQF